MVQDHRGIAVTIPSAEEPSLSASALRMRKHRQRRRQGSCCVTVELSGWEIDELIRRRRISPNERFDPDSLRQSLTKLIRYALW
jgi:hypothetical protein